MDRHHSVDDPNERFGSALHGVKACCAANALRVRRPKGSASELHEYLLV
jgi:hypothetical protein